MIWQTLSQTWGIRVLNISTPYTDILFITDQGHILYGVGLNMFFLISLWATKGCVMNEDSFWGNRSQTQWQSESLGLPFNGSYWSQRETLKNILPQRTVEQHASSVLSSTEVAPAWWRDIIDHSWQMIALSKTWSDTPNKNLKTMSTSRTISEHSGSRKSLLLQFLDLHLVVSIRDRQ